MTGKVKTLHSTSVCMLSHFCNACMTLCTMQLFACLRHLELKQLGKKLFFTKGTIIYSAIFWRSVYAATLKVVNEITTVRTATIHLQNDIIANPTINYRPCSEPSPNTKQFQSPVVHIVNLTADTLYCYSITNNVGSCNGMFNTTANTSSPSAMPPPTTGILQFVYLWLACYSTVVCSIHTL